MNKVEIVVTGQNRSKTDLAAPKKEIGELDKAATKATKSAERMNDELANGLSKRGGMSAAEEAVQSLAKTADKAFDDLKTKFNKTADDIDRTANTKMRIKPDIDWDKDRMKSSMDKLTFDFGGMDVGGKGIFSALLEGALKGGEMAKAGATGAVDFVKGLGDGLKAQHPAVQGAVYGALALAVATAAPLAGGALAGGIVAGFGAGIGGIGVLAAAQNTKVRESFSNLWAGVVADTQARARVIEDVLLKTAGRAQTVWNETGHVLAGAFARVAPGLERLLDGLLQSFQRFAPALEPMASAASAVFGDLGKRLPGIIGEIAGSFTSLAASVEKNPEALGDFVAIMGEFVEAGALVVNTLNNMHEGNKKILGMLSKPFEWVGLKETGEAVGKVGDGMLKVSNIPAGPLQSIQEAFAAIGETAEGSAARVDAVRTALDLLNGQTPDYTDALAGAAEVIGKLDGAFKTAEDRAKGFGGALLDSTGAFDVTNEKGRELYDGVRDLQDQFTSMAAAVANGQMTREQFIADTGRMRDELDKVLRQGDLTEAQIASLHERYGLTPASLLTAIQLSGVDKAEAQLAYLARDRMAYIRTQISTYGGYVGTVNGQTIFHDRAHGGVVSAFAHGGVVARAAAGGVRSSNVVVNDWGSQSYGEAIRLPQGSTVIPASMTRSMESRWGTDRGAGQAGGGTVTLKWVGPPDIIQWLKTMVRENGGDPSVFGGGA